MKLISLSLSLAHRHTQTHRHTHTHLHSNAVSGPQIANLVCAFWCNSAPPPQYQTRFTDHWLIVCVQRLASSCLNTLLICMQRCLSIRHPSSVAGRCAWFWNISALHWRTRRVALFLKQPQCSYVLGNTRFLQQKKACQREMCQMSLQGIGSEIG